MGETGIILSVPRCGVAGLVTVCIKLNKFGNSTLAEADILVDGPVVIVNKAVTNIKVGNFKVLAIEVQTWCAYLRLSWLFSSSSTVGRFCSFLSLFSTTNICWLSRSPFIALASVRLHCIASFLSILYRFEIYVEYSLDGIGYIQLLAHCGTTEHVGLRLALHEVEEVVKRLLDVPHRATLHATCKLDGKVTIIF